MLCNFITLHIDAWEILNARPSINEFHKLKLIQVYMKPCREKLSYENRVRWERHSIFLLVSLQPKPSSSTNVIFCFVNLLLTLALIPVIRETNVTVFFSFFFQNPRPHMRYFCSGELETLRRIHN